MLNDKQRRACIDASGHPEGEISQDEFDAFAAGIAYAQTQQAAMIAQARAEERERWRPIVEDMRANLSCETMHHRRAVQHGISGPCLALRELDEKIAKIRARKDGQ